MGGGFLMLHGKHGRTPLIGPVGGLVQLHGSSSVNVTRPARVTKAVALSGRVTSQRGPAPRREWEVSVGSAYPEHFQALQQLEAGAYGSGPFVFYDEYAQVTNMLSPAQSGMAASAWTGGAQGGAGTASDGTRYLTSRTTGPATNMAITDRIAVPSGVPVTASAYISTHPTTAANLVIQEFDPEGTFLGQHAAPVAADTHAQRAPLTFTPGVRTVSIAFRVHGPLMVTMPAVTLTNEVQPWAHGAGCPTVTFDLSGHAVLKAVAHPNGRRASYSMTVHELG